MQVSKSTCCNFWSHLLAHHKVLQNSNFPRAAQTAAEHLIGSVINGSTPVTPCVWEALWGTDASH